MRSNLLTRYCAGVALATLCLISPAAVMAQEEPAPPPAEGEESAGEGTPEIVVTATRLRGDVVTSQPAIAEYDERDVQALGAGSLAEVLESLGPQVNSGRGRGGGRPLILVNGRRISDFRELSSYPPEAVRKVSVLPEEVALQYGFPPDQRVVNFILKDDFASREIEFEFEQPDRGGFRRTQLELTYLRINGPQRLNASVDLQETTGLLNAERGVILDGPVLGGDLDPAAFRSLVAPVTSAEATVNWSRGLGVEGAGGALTLNGTYSRTKSRNLEGLSTVLLVGPGGEEALRTLPVALATRTRSDNYALGATLDKPLADWRLNATLNAQLSDALTLTGNGADTDALAAAALSGTLPVTGALPQPVLLAPDRATARSYSVDNIYTVSGQPLDLPAGPLTATFDAQIRWNALESENSRVLGRTELDRTRLSAGANFGIPVTERDGFGGAIGRLDLTLGGGVDHLSDFGTLWDANLGLTWRPTEKLTLQASYIPRGVAPTLTQLGAPSIVTPNVPVFDFVTGRTALVAITTGGNPNLLAEKQRDLKLALNWELPEIGENVRQASIDVEYFRNRSRDVSAAFPFLTPVIETAFPDRVLRGADGTLLALDQSPVTFARQRASRVRVAFNLAGSFTSDEEGGAAGRGRAGAAGGAAGAPGASGGASAGRGDPAAMLRRGPPSGGRWRLTVDYTRELDNTVTLAEGGPVLDLLDGDALVAGGTPTDRIGANLFGFYKGYGARASLDWFSATQVRGTGLPGSSDLTFGSRARLDLRLFADLDRVFPETEFLRGTRLAFVVDNVFDARQRVTDSAGQTPVRYQPFLIDPVGRYIGIDLRKLFL